MKRASILLFLVSSAALISCYWLPGPMQPNCSDKSVREVPSPDGKRKAIEYHSTCDEGPKQHHTMVEIADANGSNRATAMFATPQTQQPPDWPELKIEWKSVAELWITYPDGIDAQCISSPANNGVQVAVHCVDASIAR